TMSPKMEASKKKDRLIEVSKEEDVLVGLAENLHFLDLSREVNKSNYAHDKFFAVSENIEPPARLLLTGEELQEEVRRRLMSHVPLPGQNINRVRIQRRSSVSSTDSTNSLVVVIPH